MNHALELLSEPTNFAVVRLPDRHYPGVVVQGDTLNGLVRSIELMSVLLKDGKLEDLAEEIANLQSELASARDHYEVVCKRTGIKLPY